MNIKDIIFKSFNEDLITREECKFILNFPNKNLNELIDSVYEIRKKYKGNEVGVQILTNAKSGNCSQDCKYCAQSCISKANIEKYQLIDINKLLNNGKIGENNKINRRF